MAKLYETAVVSKRNVLNELRSNNMTLQELRFFSIYLSKINPQDIDTRVVRFPLDDFQKIMNLGKLNITQLKSNIDSLLTKVVHVPNENGGFSAFQLFKRCRVNKDELDSWFVEIDAHDDALPLMFDFKEKYFKYELWNALRLKSSNQIRMYEIMKQYEFIGHHEWSVQELRELLYIGENEYSGRTGWSDFRKNILDACQAALKESTDICYTYERGKTGKGGKWLTIIFHIEKNNDYIDQLTLADFIDMQPSSQLIEDDMIEGQATFFEEEIEYGSELANFLGRNALDNEFTPEQVRVIQDFVIQAVPASDYLERNNYLIRMVHKMNAQPNIKNRYAYLCKMLEQDLQSQEN